MGCDSLWLIAWISFCFVEMTPIWLIAKSEWNCCSSLNLFLYLHNDIDWAHHVVFSLKKINTSHFIYHHRHLIKGNVWNVTCSKWMASIEMMCSPSVRLMSLTRHHVHVLCSVLFKLDETKTKKIFFVPNSQLALCPLLFVAFQSNACFNWMSYEFLSWFIVVF